MSALKLCTVCGVVTSRTGSRCTRPAEFREMSPVAEPATIGLAAARARAELERGGLVGRRDQIEAELETVRALASIGPEASPTRPAARAGRQGAPFYALVDFAPGLTASDQAGLEAALEGAGILDAWMMPDGSLLGPDVLDAALDGASPRAGTGATLRSALRPVEGLAVPVELVARALDAIGLGRDRHASVAVGLEGSYRVGPLVGRFEKADAEFIGAGARELTRERAIARLEAHVKEVDDSMSGSWRCSLRSR